MAKKGVFRQLSLGLAALLLASAPNAAYGASYSIARGDLLSIYVYRQDDMSVKVRVGNDGTIRFPLAGRINVLSKSPGDIERVITSALRRGGFSTPEVVVSVESFAPRKIFVIGEVKGGENVAGDIPEGGEISAMQAISAAGGLADSADVGRIVVRRGDAAGKTTIIHVPAKEILSGQNVADILLRPSDTVVVPKALAVSVLGTVKKPGEFYISPDTPLTVSRAIALAGGVERPKSLSEIRVTRGQQFFKVNIQSLLEDGKGGNDMELRPGDVVYVPETRW